MKTPTIALALGLSTAVFAATAAAPAAAPVAPPEMRAERMERMRENAEHMKQELGLTDAQATAVRAENQRYMSVLKTVQAEHRTAIGRILTPEQMAKLDAKMKERREDRMEAMDHMEGERASPQEPKGKDKR